MNKHKFSGIRSLLMATMLLMTSALMAQTAFRKGALYHLFPATDGRVALQLDGSAIKFKNLDAAAAGQ